ncbi:hypothetical protein ACA097_27780 [Pseudomonas sp. QL9]|uniref:hypothetical protein n=1 Tax=Pseudomonas sp. QL9 TaxID=3242725 RepID=UPI00352A4D18
MPEKQTKQVKRCICQECEKVFYALSLKAKWCSKKCENANYRKNRKPQAELEKLYLQQQAMQENSNAQQQS